jgi:hypothetical protein
MTDREYIVRVPELVRSIAVDYPRHLIGDIGRTASAMRVPIDRMRTPRAPIWAAPRRDEIDAARSMMLAPDVEIFLMVNRFAIRQRQAIEVIDL